MSNIKLGESTLNNVESLKAIDASDSTKYHIFYNEQKAILIVTAPAGSTIDILQNSIVLQTYTLGASETTHEFRVSVSATQYTVRATLDTKTASKNVLVEQASFYNVGLAYQTYLYNAGNECSAVSGGWSFPSLATTWVGRKLDNTAGWTVNRYKRSNCFELYVYCYNDSYAGASVYCKPLIDIRNYQYFKVNFRNSNTGQFGLLSCFRSVKPDGIGMWDSAINGATEISTAINKSSGTIIFDVSTLNASEETYVSIGTCSTKSTSGTTSGTFYIDKVWLE